MIRISVIMPVYNVEEYIEETLDSLINQTMINDIEVIIIDDGSTDNSRYVIEDYIKDLDNFQVFHKKHEGQAIARNFGIDLAQGEYIHFMDADDYIPPKAYENLYYFNPYNDFVVGNVLRYGEYNIWENKLFKNAFSEFNDDVHSFKLFDYPQVLWDTVIWNKLFKKEFLDKYNLRFINEDIDYEDLLFSLQAYIHAESIGFSRNIFYFWRKRKDNSSITLKENDVKNFQDRIEILEIYAKLMDVYELPDDIKSIVYSKWLNHDLRISIKKIRNYPGKYYIDLLLKTRRLLKMIPDEIKNNLGFYLRILYKIVENNDISSLLLFAHLEDDLKENPHIQLPLGEQYTSLIDADCDMRDEDYEVRITDVFNDEKKLYLEFRENLSFAPQNCRHDCEVFLVTREDELPLKVQGNRIIIPLDLIKDKNHLKIKVLYKTKNFTKTALLKNYSRLSLRYADFDIDVGIGINNILYLDVKNKTDNRIVVQNIFMEDGEFILKCESLYRVENLILTNFVTYRQSLYPARYAPDSNTFLVVIPFDDLKDNVIKKYELNCNDSFNSIELANHIKFIYNNWQINFKNKRNKIFIAYKSVNGRNDEIEEIKSKNEKLLKQNSKLSGDNISLSRNLDEFKSRKSVQMVDNLRNIFK